MIKFRAWDKVQNKMLLPDNIEFIHGQAYWAEASTDGNGSYSNDGKVDGIGALFELEQFTGLKDANGNDIYEGDIVEVTSQYWGMLGNRYEVKFKQGAFYVKYGLLSEISPSISVIGNVHTNPELLEEKK
ncbi:YopX family protein [Lactiplantibacillus plantarum]|uniref:YopX family protein n=1 Tax=Lactiplantibacillus plantarum TaxID=1590 RepID=UPI002014BCB9|nr:YopX family protein [Lactiplantibacillus plantarum]DAU56448.1 MAG TPA: YopX protein [Caudoviricetes sp.]